MQSSYDTAIKGVLESEGGYSNDPGDPGGPTNWGITIWDARLYWKRDSTALDVRRMPREVALQIYKSKYWDKVHGDELPAGVDYVVFDYAVNSGLGRAIPALQRAVGVPADGVYGPQTAAAVAKADPITVINQISDARLSFLHRLRTWRLFGRGWGPRVDRVRHASINLAKLAEQNNGPH